MTETVSGVHTFGSTWWGHFFRKTKKEKKMTYILTECNNRLTCMIEEQSRLISSLTFENGRNDNIIKEYEGKINRLSDDIGKLEDAIKRSNDSREGQRDKIQNQYYDIQSLTSEKQHLMKTKTDLEHERARLQELINAKEEQLFQSTERLDKVQSDKDRLLETNSALTNDLTVTNQTLFEETVTNQLLRKDYQIAQRDLEDDRNNREKLAHKVEELQKRLFTVATAKNRSENEMGAVNECLKYEVVILQKEVERKRQREKKLQKDKELILQYYRNQETHFKSLESSAADLLNKEKNLNLKRKETDEIKAYNHNNYLTEMYYADDLNNKVFSLESMLYRRSQLIDELADIIREYDPNFTIEGSPVLKHYLDMETTLVTNDDKTVPEHPTENSMCCIDTYSENNFDVPMISDSNVTNSDNNSLCSDISSPNSDISIPNSDISTPNSDISTPFTDISTPNSDISIPNSDISTPNSDISIPFSDISTPNSNISIPFSDISTPNSNISIPFSDISTPNSDISIPFSDISTSSDNNSIQENENQSALRSKTRGLLKSLKLYDNDDKLQF